MKAFLPVAVLLLAGCQFSDESSENYVPPVTQGGGGSSDNGGGGSTGSGPGAPTQPPPAGAPINPTGIWDLNDKVNGETYTAVALIGNGQYFHIATANQFGCGDVAGGPYTITADTFAGTGAMELFSSCSGSLSDAYFPFTFSGSMTGTTLNLTFSVNGAPVPTLGATVDPLYNETSSLTKLVGNWNDNGNTMTINADGSFFEQQSSGCVVNGAITIIDSTHNLYGVSFEITNCSSSIAGIAFSGLGYLDDSNPNPALTHFNLDVSGNNAAQGGQLVIEFDSFYAM